MKFLVLGSHDQRRWITISLLEAQDAAEAFAAGKPWGFNFYCVVSADDVVEQAVNQAQTDIFSPYETI